VVDARSDQTVMSGMTKWITVRQNATLQRHTVGVHAYSKFYAYERAGTANGAYRSVDAYPADRP
jgi:hypothetical protein